MFWGATHLLLTLIFPNSLSALFLITCTAVLLANGLVCQLFAQICKCQTTYGLQEEEGYCG